MTTLENQDIRKKFGDRIRQLRQIRGISQENLAHLSGLDRSYIGGVERGERNISLINIQKIANALNISLRELFDE
ncbi:MAG TPA: helix-turn-helix transcriptional regulator [Nostocaceae cyanobacterium]|nr:helix-turn-helix transcriptional regulator [Nostocaceae cyanobacterium]